MSTKFPYHHPRLQNVHVLMNSAALNAVADNVIDAWEYTQTLRIFCEPAPWLYCVYCVHCALASAFEFAETDLKGDEYEPIIKGNWLSNALCRHSESGKGMMMIARNEEKCDTHDCRRLITLAGTCRRTSTWIFHLFPGRFWTSNAMMDWGLTRHPESFWGALGVLFFLLAIVRAIKNGKGLQMGFDWWLFLNLWGILRSFYDSVQNPAHSNWQDHQVTHGGLEWSINCLHLIASSRMTGECTRMSQESNWVP